MHVLLVSQCNKQALPETRRILDQFAERKGQRTWQTPITMQGLDTLRKMLKKTARRNTSVACHWIKSGDRTELLWIVGNSSKFNERGLVPTDTTSRDILRTLDENLWNRIEDIAVLAGLAGLFHDFGKSNRLFQKKLEPNYKGKSFEPYRHEWVSLRMFEAFVGGNLDHEWLHKLKSISLEDEKHLLENISKDDSSERPISNSFKFLNSPKRPLAQIVGWLILSHHRMPKWAKAENKPEIRLMEYWLENSLNPSWNSPQCLEAVSIKCKEDVWRFEHGTPIRSKTWRDKAKSIAKRALGRKNIIAEDWLSERFVMHVARMILMLADHHYSGYGETKIWQDLEYKCFANTDRRTKRQKQKLDEHSIGVAHNAIIAAKILPSVRANLPAITRHKAFKRRSENEKFRWQDKAYELACGIKDLSTEHGFFGINMASTGLGKTFANARIIYGLSNEKVGCRFSIALGLRTLTLQTGDSLRERLNLDEEDLAVLIGSQAVKDLHDYNSENYIQKVELGRDTQAVPGSESAEDFFSEDQHVRYEGSLNDERFKKLLGESDKLKKLISSPILACTIDHLIPATEGERGGKQIAPMLRLLTSDLVLDEPDDFSLEDIPALTRLVNWAGLLGSRVLLSSATLPPSLVTALFDAYLEGRREYQKACGSPFRALNICCAWFDEYKVKHGNYSEIENFKNAHKEFINDRVARLQEKESQKVAKLLPIHIEKHDSISAVKAIAEVCSKAAFELHSAHCEVEPSGQIAISIGLIRMANIKQMVAVAKELLLTTPPPEAQVHYCIYHSQYPLIVRSEIEKTLDTVLKRHKPETIWSNPEIKNALKNYPAKNHIFIVLATSVAEVGRDHDYDWAIAEPSSMRSLIQLAGRVLRHREKVPRSPNIFILRFNYRGLMGQEVAFMKPGFESKHFHLKSKDLNEILLEGQYKNITAIPRIKEGETLNPGGNLVDLEHVHLQALLNGEATADKLHASLWWKSNPHWSAEIQRRSPFRKSEPDEEYVLGIEDETEKAKFFFIDREGGKKDNDYAFEREALIPVKGVAIWALKDIQELLMERAKLEDQNLDNISRRYGTVRLRVGKKYYYNSILGIYEILQ